MVKGNHFRLPFSWTLATWFFRKKNPREIHNQITSTWLALGFSEIRMTNEYSRRRMMSIIRSSLISGESPILRRLYTAATENVAPEKRPGVNKAILYDKLWMAGSNGGKISDVLNDLKRQGEVLSNTDLISCVRKLRKHSRYHNCLEVTSFLFFCFFLFFVFFVPI